MCTALRQLLALFLLLCFGLASCGLPSVNPIYTDKQRDTLFLPELVGTWEYQEDDDEDEFLRFRFEQDDGNSYTLHVQEGKDAQSVVETKYEAHLVRLGNQLFLDTFLSDAPLEEESIFFVMHVVPVHLIWALKVDGDVLSLAMLRSESLVRDLKEERVDLANVDLDYGGHERLLTAPSSELRAFLAEHADRAGYLFDDVGEFQRIGVDR